MQRILGGVARTPSPRCAVLPASLPSARCAGRGEASAPGEFNCQSSEEAAHSAAIVGRSDEHPLRRGDRFNCRDSSDVMDGKGLGTHRRGHIGGLSNRVAALGKDSVFQVFASTCSGNGAVSWHTPYKVSPSTRARSIPDEADEVLDWECTRTPSQSSGQGGHRHGGAKNCPGSSSMEPNTHVGAGSWRSLGRDSDKGNGRFDVNRGAYSIDTGVGGRNSSTRGYGDNNRNNARESLQGKSNHASLGGMSRGGLASPSRGDGRGRSNRGCEEVPFGRRFSSNSTSGGGKRAEQHFGDEAFPLDSGNAFGPSMSHSHGHGHTGCSHAVGTARFVDRDAGALSSNSYSTNGVNGKVMRGCGKGRGRGAHAVRGHLGAQSLECLQGGGKDSQCGNMTEEERQRTHIALNRSILDCNDAEQILELIDARIDEFNHVNIVTAFHRIAKHEKARGAVS
eukprot:TRINITY_DN33031_c0_g1_i1.p1 TRINITY_DN33031_c0_g1~~TRINITY_DN33031_c0_g1_i1.p1  ORF type:complete len:452 (-),score=66.56 TRINITY_DN33031_c0_g1_i1:62-1417(-)